MEKNIKNIRTAFNALKSGKDLLLRMKYWGYETEVLFKAAVYGDDNREIAFRHKVKCEKDDFRSFSTFHGGNKSDCVFTWTELD